MFGVSIELFVIQPSRTSLHMPFLLLALLTTDVICEHLRMFSVYTRKKRLDGCKAIRRPNAIYECLALYPWLYLRTSGAAMSKEIN